MLESNLQKISSTYSHENPWFKVREDLVRKNDDESIFYVVECPESVFIVPVTDDEKIVLIKQFRYRTQRDGWEVPAGSVDLGESRVNAARRELQEETGFIAGSIRELKSSFDSMNGTSDAVGYVFVATDLSQSGSDEQAEEGVTDMRAFSWKEIFELIANGAMVDGLSIAALMKYYTELSRPEDHKK